MQNEMPLKGIFVKPIVTWTISVTVYIVYIYMPYEQVLLTYLQLEVCWRWYSPPDRSSNLPNRVSGQTWRGLSSLRLQRPLSVSCCRFHGRTICSLLQSCRRNTAVLCYDCWARTATRAWRGWRHSVRFERERARPLAAERRMLATSLGKPSWKCPSRWEWLWCWGWIRRHQINSWLGTNSFWGAQRLTRQHAPYM